MNGMTIYQPKKRPKNKLQASEVVPQAPIPVPNQDHFPRVPRQSRLSANDNGDNEMISGAVHRSPSIYRTAEENLS